MVVPRLNSLYQYNTRPVIKATAGLCQPLIALMPPHRVYLETHLGGGAIRQRKLAALRNIGIDIDALARFQCAYPVELVQGCAHEYLAHYPFDGTELVYSDPPYLHRTRKSARRYRHDYNEGDRAALLALLTSLPCAVMVSGYPSAWYDERLAGWRRVTVAGAPASPRPPAGFSSGWHARD